MARAMLEQRRYNGVSMRVDGDAMKYLRILTICTSLLAAAGCAGPGYYGSSYYDYYSPGYYGPGYYGYGYGPYDYGF